MSKIVLGTASWGQTDYGLKKDKVPLRMIRAICRMAKDQGIKLVHYKPVYKEAYGVGEEVLDIIQTAGLKTCCPPDYYDNEQVREAVKEKNSVSVMYNPLRQCVMEELHNYQGTVYVRSVLLQGFLTSTKVEGPSKWRAKLWDRRAKLAEAARLSHWGLPQYCIKGAICHPYVDYVILGLNSIGELKAALEAEQQEPPVTFQPIHDLGEYDGTDPRKWEVSGDRKAPMEQTGVRRSDQKPARNVAHKRQSRRKRR